MNIQKYRTLYLSLWAQTTPFRDITKDVPPGKFLVKTCLEGGCRCNEIQDCLVFSQEKNHPLVLSGKAFWTTENTICVGYELIGNPEIFRPIFSHKRQRLLDEVNKDIIKPIKFWNKIKSKYFLTFSENKKIPLECIKIIINFIH